MSELGRILDLAAKIKLSSHDPHVGAYCDSIINSIDHILSKKVEDENVTLLQEKVKDLTKFIVSFGNSTEIQMAESKLIEALMWVERHLEKRK